MAKKQFDPEIVEPLKPVVRERLMRATRPQTKPPLDCETRRRRWQAALTQLGVFAGMEVDFAAMSDARIVDATWCVIHATVDLIVDTPRMWSHSAVTTMMQWCEVVEVYGVLWVGRAVYEVFGAAKLREILERAIS